MLGFASFYVMNWTGSNGNQSDHCPDTTFDHDHNASTPQIPLPNPPAGAISGVFVETVELRAWPRRPDRDLRRGPAHAVPRGPRPLIPDRPWEKEGASAEAPSSLVRCRTGAVRGRSDRHADRHLVLLDGDAAARCVTDGHGAQHRVALA